MINSTSRDCGGDSQLMEFVVRKGGSKTVAFARLWWRLMTCDLWRNWCRVLARVIFHFSVRQMGKGKRKKKNVNRAQMLIRRRLTACHLSVQRATRVRVGVSEMGACSSDHRDYNLTYRNNQSDRLLVCWPGLSCVESNFYGTD
jgi:hypothetical protein